jgi:MFS family permease
MFWERIKGAFRETPWTMTLIAGNLVVWLLDFFGVSAPMALLGGELDVPHAWRWITYPFASPALALWLFLGLFCFFLFASSLERRWGSLRFGRIFLVLTILCSLALWVATALTGRTAQPTVQAWGIAIPSTALFMIWASLHREMTILFMFVIPVMAKYLALATVVLAFLSPMGPLYGLPFALLFAGCWKWAGSYGSGSGRAQAPSPRRRRSLSQWWSERKRAKRKGRFQILEGGSPLASQPRSANLHSLSKMPPKPEEPSEKELDRILDKIRFEGMNSLTDAERATLDGQSRRLRGDV